MAGHLGQPRHESRDRNGGKVSVRHEATRVVGIRLCRQCLDPIGSMQSGILLKHRPLRVRLAKDNEDVARLRNARPLCRARQIGRQRIRCEVAMSRRRTGKCTHILLLHPYDIPAF